MAVPVTVGVSTPRSRPINGTKRSTIKPAAIAQTKVGLARNGNRRHHPDERHAHDHRETCADRTNPDALDEGHQSAGEQIGAYQEGRVRCGQVER